MEKIKLKAWLKDGQRIGIFRKIKHKLKSWPQVATPGAVVIGLVILVRLAGSLQSLEWLSFDRLMRSRSPEPADQRITIVGITENDIRSVGYPVPDRELAALLTKLASYKPRVMALDIFRDLPVEPGSADLTKAFKSFKNIIGIEKSILPDAQNSTVAAPPTLPNQQVGFADVIFDGDGHVRRQLLSGGRLEGGYQFSLALRLAELYLRAEGFEIENGIIDKNAMRFASSHKSVELNRFQADDGSYIREDAGGNQMLLNWRRGQAPFAFLSLKQVQAGDFNPDLIRDRIVVVGMTAASVKDTLTIPALSDVPVDGVYFHAHSTSAIISAVLDGRPQVQFLPDSWEYIWIIIWGSAGIALVQGWRSILRTFVSLSTVSLSLVGICYVAISFGWWLPLVPALIALLGAGVVTRYIQDLRSLIEQRQQIIEQRQRTLDEAFNALHNGPLHTLAEILSAMSAGSIETEKLGAKLLNLDRELREVYESIRPETLAKQISTPLHELLYEIYYKTLKRDFAGFKDLKVKIPDIQPIDEFYLTPDQKHELCVFLEEALCNVGKHASGATQLKITCKQDGSQCRLQVIDNGKGDGKGVLLPPDSASRERGGTKQARNLAKQLGGTFKRSPQSPHGTICEISWPVTES